ncbi:hypothetical protein [Nocardia sp. NPDC051832]|uniref:hypothetical protein n=1 Tax=Nocardia sp. NPDC051832 TaxID=3155673 RepID=UPI00343E93B6
MTPDSARELLLFHSGAHNEVDDPRWQQGFLGMLRPYHGLREENFHSVMACVRVLAPALERDSVDREMIQALWAICHFGRAWGVWPDSMLRRNNLITEEDAARLSDWIETISYAMACVLEGIPGEGFHEYDRSQPASKGRSTLGE